MAKHYIRLDEKKRVVHGFSTAHEQLIDGDVCIEENGGRHFNLDLIDERGLPKLKYINGEIVAVVDADISDELAELTKENLRLQREIECFVIINRGQLWYDILTTAQRAELNTWYADWLDVTSTLVVPTEPTWLSEV